MLKRWTNVCLKFPEDVYKPGNFLRNANIKKGEIWKILSILPSPPYEKGDESKTLLLNYKNVSNRSNISPKNAKKQSVKDVL